MDITVYSLPDRTPFHFQLQRVIRCFGNVSLPRLNLSNPESQRSSSNVIRVLMLLFMAVYDDFVIFFLQLSTHSQSRRSNTILSWVRDSYDSWKVYFQTNQTPWPQQTWMTTWVWERERKIGNEIWEASGRLKRKTGSKKEWFVIALEMFPDLQSVTLPNLAYISA